MSRPTNEMVQMFTMPSEYQRAAAEARRRQRMAEMLAAQEYDPTVYQNAPIPAAAPLVQGLQAFIKGRLGRQAEEAAQTAEKAGRKELTDYIRSFEPEERTVSMGDIAAMEAGMPQIDASGRVSYAPASAVAAPNQRVVPAMTATGEPDINQPLQMRIGGPLTLAQKRARALEGFESTNPLVQQFALSQYEKTMPKELDLKMAAIDPSKVDMASVAEAQRTGDVSKIKPQTEPSKPKTIVKEVDLGNKVELHFSDGTVETRTKGVAPTAGGGGSKETAEGLRKEFTGQTSQYRGVADAFQKIKSAAINPSAANDLSLIFGFMRALDPASTVREGEFANAQNAGGVDAAIRNIYNRVASGERLTQEQRQDFLQSAYGLVESQIPNVEQITNRYSDIASRSGLDPRNVVSNPFEKILIPRLKDDNDPIFNSLKKGDLFIAPNGRMMRKR